MCRWGCSLVDSTYMCKWCGTRFCKECLLGDFFGKMKEPGQCRVCNQKRCQGKRVEYVPRRPDASDEAAGRGKRGGGTGARSAGSGRRSAKSSKSAKSTKSGGKKSGKKKSGGKKSGKKKRGKK